MDMYSEQIKFLQYRVEALEEEVNKKNANIEMYEVMVEKLRYTIVTKMNTTDKVLVNDDKFLSCIDELATQITEMNFGDETWTEEDGHGVWEEQSIQVFSEEAQDYYNEMFCEYEELINATLNVWNKQREI